MLRDFSIQKIQELSKGKEPFFLEHCFMKVHADNFHQEFEGKSGSKYPYKDDVVEVDAYIGYIVKPLHDAGVLDNTFVFITSDNGLSWTAGPTANMHSFVAARPRHERETFAFRLSRTREGLSSPAAKAMNFST